MANYTTEREMKSKILNRFDIKGSSVSSRTNISKDSYEVFSYSTLICRAKVSSNEVEYFDNSYYSTTTSKIQNILIDCFGLNNGSKKRDK